MPPLSTKLHQLINQLPNQPVVMGIINVTPDSFSDGGHYHAPEQALAHALKLHGEGAAILDIGGESTRPGAAPVSEQEEQARIKPAIQAIRQALPQALLSIDTYRATTADVALKAGANLVNDVGGLQRDPEMAGIVAVNGAALIIMHNRWAAYEGADILGDITAFFDASLELAEKAGIPRTRILLDPGLGFGKTTIHNLLILKNLARFTSFGLPLVIGLSRKRWLGELLHVDVDARDQATLAANLAALKAGASVLRVHDVKNHVHALTLWRAINEI